MDERNIVPHSHALSDSARSAMKGHAPAVLWFTGLSGSGKSTLANAVELRLHQLGVHTYLLDGDNIRTGLNRDLGFSLDDRSENIRRIGEVARLFYDAGLVVLTAFISPLQRDRARVRELLPDGAFVEIFVDCPLEICEQRDPKGLYRKARSGELDSFTGISSPYEPPSAPELKVQSGEETLEECAARVVDYLQDQHII